MSLSFTTIFEASASGMFCPIRAAEFRLEKSEFVYCTAPLYNSLLDRSSCDVEPDSTMASIRKVRRMRLHLKEIYHSPITPSHSRMAHFSIKNNRLVAFHQSESFEKSHGVSNSIACR